MSEIRGLSDISETEAIMTCLELEGRLQQIAQLRGWSVLMERSADTIRYIQQVLLPAQRRSEPADLP